MDVARLRRELTAVAVEADRAPMEAYMKHRSPFLGVKTPARRAASKPFIRSMAAESVDEVLAAALALREQPEREFHYVASDLLRANCKRLRAPDISMLSFLVTTDSWWDTVDALASPTIGQMVSNHPELVDVMDAWIGHDDMWLARVAIIHQLRFADDTDADRLFRYALRRAGDPEFFIRKAIGWALRQYARTDPDAVRSFVDAHRDAFAPLTIREATRHL
jgi:3-methyladenine DNA glycosylase AlkD